MTTTLPIRRGVLALAATAGLLAVPALPATATSGPAAHAARSCSVPKYPGNGYFTSLRVSHTSCGNGRKVARAHYSCRRAHGVRGRCRHAVRHYHCKEYRPASGRTSTEYNARVTCKRGGRRVVFTYQQNT